MNVEPMVTIRITIDSLLNIVYMKDVVKLIKDKIADCKRLGDSFTMPYMNRDEVKVEEIKHPTTGSVLLHREYNVSFADGGSLVVDYQSKDKCRTFQNNPDRSYITVRCSDPSLDFVDSWDEKY